MKNLIIFDLDGVITSEEAYWDCAGLTLHELLYSPLYWHLTPDQGPYQPAANAATSRAVSRASFPEWLILSFKARALNSNWDTAYATICLHLIALLAQLPERAELQPLQPWDASWLAHLRAQVRKADLAQTWDREALHRQWQKQHPLDQPVFQGASGLALFEQMDTYASQELALPITGVFSRRLPFWRFCQDIFQSWLLGDELYARTPGHAILTQPGKPGCLFFEEPLLPPAETRATLEQLQQDGYTIGMATGRVRQEAAMPLEQHNLLHYFDEQHRATYDVVVWGEKQLRARTGQPWQDPLGKPHPFHFLVAVDREQALRSMESKQAEALERPAIVVGDSTSDILGGRAAGMLTVAVLTGARSSEAQELLLKSQPDFVIADITRLPALLQEHMTLATIQKLQFTRRETAEKLLRLWLFKHMDIPTRSVRLVPRAVSLNSFNGFYTSQGQDYFFKTHIEEQGTIHEYYHARLLEEAGYNLVRPLRLLHENERQMVIYPLVTWPTMFDLLHTQEAGQELPAGIDAETFLAAEFQACRQLLSIYQQTFEPEQESSQAPIHQLFWLRLTGGRFQQFYRDKQIPLPTGSELAQLPFEQILQAHWRINGVEQEQTLAELIARGGQILDPTKPTATIVGHGDAHFGNVFLESSALPKITGESDEQTIAPNPAIMAKTQRFLYFDPAFAGRHSPLLDIVKPLFHNIFATWMYFPDEVARDLHITVRVTDGWITLQHNYQLTWMRQALLHTKQEHLLKPLLAWLEARQTLPDDWQEFLRLALMCCPLLTVDLFDQAKRPPSIGWLGLSQAIQLGNTGLDPWKEVQS